MKNGIRQIMDLAASLRPGMIPFSYKCREEDTMRQDKACGGRYYDGWYLDRAMNPDHHYWFIPEPVGEEHVLNVPSIKPFDHMINGV